MVRKLRFRHEKIDVCLNGCMLHCKKSKEKKECSICGHSRYKPPKIGKPNQSKILYNVLLYLPLTPRLQRFYMSTNTAKHMTWHHETCHEPRVMCHPCDSEAWKQFNQCHPEFTTEPCNVGWAIFSSILLLSNNCNTI